MADFNGNGFNDLVVGAPGKTNEEGRAFIFLGRGGGAIPILNPAGKIIDQMGLPGSLNEPGDLFGSAMTWGDFNGDGNDDLLIGAPGESPGGVVNDRSGAAYLYHGDATGVTIVQRILDQAGQDTNEAGDLFGSAMTSGDFNGNGRLDVVVGAPGETIDGIPRAGAAFVYFGQPNPGGPALPATANQMISQDLLGVEINEDGDLFGSALAAGDFNGDGRADLAVGAPGESPGAGTERSGAIFLYEGGLGNALVAPAAGGRRGQGAGGGASTNEDGDLFGSVLAVGDFDDNGFDDLAVGAPGETVGPGNVQSGAVYIFNGTAGGLSTAYTQLTQAGTGANEIDDLFGSALAVGDFDNNGFDDLAVGAPGESIDGIPQAGSVHIFNGSGAGLVGSAEITQVNRGAINNPGDLFGATLHAGDFDNNAFADLAVGAPGEYPAGAPESGFVHIFSGSGAGLVDGGELSQATVPGGTNEIDDLFGAALLDSPAFIDNTDFIL